MHMYLKTPEELLSLLVDSSTGYNRGKTEFHAPSYIVSTNTLSPEQIAAAHAERRMYVDSNGFGYVVIFGAK